MLEDILNNTEGYTLDFEQRAVVLDHSDSLLVIAGAGSGKTLTILAKIRYLIDILGIPPREIVCISFTRDTVQQLKEKLKKYYSCDFPVYTFHKLSLEILKGDFFQIAPSDLLSYTMIEYFNGIIEAYPKVCFFLLLYFYRNPFSKDAYRRWKESRQFQNFCFEVIQVIQKLKTEGIHKEQLLWKKTFLPRRRFFFRLLYLLMNEYEQELNSQGMIDFDDMISLATKKIEEHGVFKVRYILVDEYQDTSNTRFSFIRSLKNKTGAKLMVVGDDFQSIYRFSGCKLELFVHFTDYFPGATILKLQNTYRNSMNLVQVASSFILKNKNQMDKVMKSNKSLLDPIHIIWYRDEKIVFLHLIRELYQLGKRHLMVLGRNNLDIHFILSNNFQYTKDGVIYWLEHPDLVMDYKTVHRSKGLEAEDVILIHLENSTNGFPNQRRDSWLGKAFFSNYDFYPYAEERRLFYVALTRTKNRVYLLVNRKNPSIFVLEIMKLMRHIKCVK
ncbi:MAG: UvrD-helicase domain-containing protein [Bacilli bacterium]|nr:UvrD-helicase domain-containing protein [Bacilli bacterium]